MKLDYLNSGQQELVSDFLNAFCNNPTRKKDGLNFLEKWDENFTTYDTALPLSLIQEKKESDPTFDSSKFTFDHVMDYSNGYAGELLNVPARAVEVLRFKVNEL